MMPHFNQKITQLSFYGLCTHPRKCGIMEIFEIPLEECLAKKGKRDDEITGNGLTKP